MKRGENFRTIFLIFLVFILFTFMISYISAANVCCEKTIKGGVCIDTTAENCAAGASKTPTSCSQTSFCKMGTCIDNTGGECKPNTPKKACDSIGGYWDERDEEEISQCQKACCYIGGQAIFVTQASCKTQSGLYGFEMVFDKSITNSVECLASGLSEEKGACVYSEEAGFGNTCRFTTEKECRKLKSDNPESNAEFFKDFLCTAEELNTNCAIPRGTGIKTTCNEEKVYFRDTCGNLANVYDSSKINDAAYWTKIVNPDESCGAGENNANSKTCGNCNYNLGSICAKAERGETATPTYGENICKDLGCKYNGKTYQHGEKWCASTPGTSVITDKVAIPNSSKENLPGSRYVVMSCYYGEVDYTACADFRSEVCVENTVTPDGKIPVRNAACLPNLWRECIDQSTKENCEDLEKRDCKWVPVFARTDDDRLTTWKPSQEGDAAPLIKTDSDLLLGRDLRTNVKEINELIKNSNLDIKLGNYELNSKNMISFQNGVCVPRYAPGFDFRGNTSGGTPEQMKNLSNEAQEICSLASARCIIKYEKGIGGTWKAVENSECEPDPNGPYLWYQSMKNICSSLGDCDSTLNYVGDKGDIKDDLTGPE